MQGNRPIFVKITGVILILLLPIVLLYTYFSQTSFHVIDKQISNYNESQLLFLKSQIELGAERLAMSSSVLTRDSSVLNLQVSMLTKDYYRMIDLQMQLKEKLYLQSFSSNWTNTISVYLPDLQTRISTNLSEGYNGGDLDKAANGKWQFQPGSGNEAPFYQLLIWDPYFSKENSTPVNAVYEVRFGLDNIRKMLQHYKLESPGGCFLLTRSGHVFSNSETADTAVAGLGASLLQGELSDIGHRSLAFEGEQTYLSYAYLPALDAWLIDYVPLSVFHAPIVQSRNLFYASMLVLVILGFVASYLLYLHVQKPISLIMKGLKHFEMGDYAFRINKRFHNEFDYMMQRFNDMGREIQHLIQNVYEEQNRSRLATLKQLQSQINPHFLYNCLSFIAGCAKAGLTDTIKEMAYHLGGYYRYTTRVENQMPLLKEEIDLVRHYLQIYALRLERLDYQIDVPPDMLDAPVMRLIVQPVVENAVMHGIEPKPGRGSVRISGRRESSGWNILQIEDSGMGMTEDRIVAYMRDLERPMDERTGCGLWNVHQRLKQRFGPGAGICIEPSKQLSGLCVRLSWKDEEDDAEGGGRL